MSSLLASSANFLFRPAKLFSPVWKPKSVSSSNKSIQTDSYYILERLFPYINEWLQVVTSINSPGTDRDSGSPQLQWKLELS
jgi:hypothetical protein